MATHSSTFAWEIPWTEELGMPQSMGSQRVRLDLVTKTTTNTAYTKINSKCIQDLNIRPGTIKLSEENICRTLFDINHSRFFFLPTS